MAKLIHSHESFKKKPSGIVKQVMVIEVEYDPREDHIKDIEVFIYEGGVMIAEISQLLDDAEGNPLLTMIEEIDWRELYHDKKELVAA